MKKLSIIRKMTNAITVIGYCLLVIGTVACEDMLDSDSSRQVFDPSLDQKTDSVFYALGILQGMQQLADQYAFQGEMQGDLVETTTYTDNNLRQLANFSATTENKYDSAYVYYRVINNCNYYIAHRDTTLRTGATYVTMKEYVAVKAIRAWAYMQLARIYQKVPFYTVPLTQISQIDDANFPELDMAGIVSQLTPDLEQYSHAYNPNLTTDYNQTPTFGNVAPSSILPQYLFIPVDVVLGDLYLETGNYDKAARHYISYLTDATTENHSAFMQTYTRNQRRASFGDDELPGNWNAQRNGQLQNSSLWSSIFTSSAGLDFITYIPLAESKLEGVASEIPLAYGYDYYANSSSYVDEIQITPSNDYLKLTNSSDFCYVTTATDEVSLDISSAKLGDTRYKSIIREDEDDETNETKVWITKNTTPKVVLYRRSTVYLHLAEALNRLGMYDAAFAILKDGINKYLVIEEGGAQYIKPETRLALTTTYPLLSDDNISKFSNDENCFGIHTHGGGYTRDYTGSTYQPGLSPYQCDTIIGLKLAELAANGYAVGTTKQDSINAMEDLICDEMALELSFEGCRWYDLKRIATHKNQAGLYGSNFGSLWLSRKLAYKNPAKDLADPNNWYLPFK